MTTAHTPGPWRYEPHRVDSNYMIITCSDDQQEGDNLRGYCGEANARLIASAPDLLEALEEVVEFFSPCAGGSERNRADALRMAIAAVAKATATVA